MPEATSAAARSCPRYPRTRRSPQPPLSRTSVSRWIGSVTNPVAAPQAPRRNDSAVELRHSPTLCAPQPLDGKRALLTRRSRSSDGFCTRVSPYRPSRTGRRWRCTRWTEDLGFPKASPAPVSCPGWRGTRGSRDASCGKHKVESGRLDLAVDITALPLLRPRRTLPRGGCSARNAATRSAATAWPLRTQSLRPHRLPRARADTTAGVGTVNDVRLASRQIQKRRGGLRSGVERPAFTKTESSRGLSAASGALLLQVRRDPKRERRPHSR